MNQRTPNNNSSPQTDGLAHGRKLQLHGKLTTKNNTADERQIWSVMTNGSIVSSIYTNLGLGLVRHGDSWDVEICDFKKSSEHYAWHMFYGKFESRYSEIHKKEILVLVALERIILMLGSSRQGKK